MDTAHLEELIASAGIGGLAVYAIIRMIAFMASRDTTEAKKDERQDTKELAYIELLQKLASNIEAQTEANKQQTEALKTLSVMEGQAHDLLSEMRRDVGLKQGQQLEHLAAIQNAIADLPTLTAQHVRAALITDLLTSRDKIDEAITKIAALTEIDKARPITPAPGALAESVESVRATTAESSESPARETTTEDKAATAAEGTGP